MSKKISSSLMSTMFLKVVLIAILLQMTSSKEGCKRYFIKSNVGINGCHNKVSLEQEIHSVQCPEYCEKDPKCKAVVADTSYRTKSCCMLYGEPVGIGSETQTVYYKSTAIEIPETDITAAKSFEGYDRYPGMFCDTGLINTRPEIKEIDQCVTKCNENADCWGFTFEGKCMLRNGSCRYALEQVENTIVTTYVKKN